MRERCRAASALRAALALCALITISVRSAHAHADEVDGLWSFALEARGNGFEQRSSRVVVPEVALAATSPDGLRLSGSYLLDVISSASIAQSGGDGDEVFTELRHGALLGVEQALDDTQLSVRAGIGVSLEDDYSSASVKLGSTLSLFERTTLLSLDASLSRDLVASNLDPGFEGELIGLALRASVERVLTKTLVLTGGYAIAWLHGFQSNPYRRVLVGPLPYPEHHPDDRLRHELSVQLKLAVPATETVLHLGARGYLDSWDILALSPELRVYQTLWQPLRVLLHYRYYTQTSAFFFERSYAAGITAHVTNDPKMAALYSHTLGAGIELELPWLTLERARFGRETTLDLAIDRYLSSSAYGDGFMASVGYRMAF